MKTTFALAALALLVAVPAPARAQDSISAKSGGFCFRPNPASDCTWFPITEFGVALVRSPKKGDWGRIWQVGLLHEVGARTALGAAVTVTDEDATTVTLSPVGRLRISPDLALDVAPGVVVHGLSREQFPAEYPTPDVWIQTFAVGRAPGFAVDASLSYKDWGVLFVRTSVLPYEEVVRSTATLIDLPGGGTSWQTREPESVPRKGSVTETWVGVRAGSYAGLGTGALAALVTVIANSVIEN
jgi:hypothetical protein